MGLQIKINGFQMDLAAKSKLSMELFNPYLMYDSIPLNAIKAPVFPDTPRNRQVFGWWEDPQSGGMNGEYNWQHFYNGELIREGYYYLKEAQEKKGYTGEFDDKMNRFFGDFQDKTLREIDFGTLPLVNTPTYEHLSMLAYCRPSIINSDFYGTNGASVSYTGRMNDYFAGVYVSNSPAVPAFFVNYIIKRIAQITGVTITGNFLTHNTWKYLLLINTQETPGALVDVNSHLPDMKLTDFFLEIRKIPNLKFEFSTIERTMKLNFWEDDLAQPAEIDWSNKAVNGQVKRPEVAPRIQLGYELDGGDGLMKDKPAIIQDYVGASTNGTFDNIAPLKSKFSTILKDDATNLGIIKQIGVSDLFSQSANKFSPRLAFWAGVDSLPRALPSLDGYSLYWTGPNGLAATSWKRTEAMRREQFYLVKSFVLNETDLAKLNFAKKIHYRGMNYLIGSLYDELPIKSAANCLLVGGC